MGVIVVVVMAWCVRARVLGYLPCLIAPTNTAGGSFFWCSHWCSHLCPSPAFPHALPSQAGVQCSG